MITLTKEQVLMLHDRLIEVTGGSKVQRTMKKLVDEGVIENIGSHRRGQWKVKKF